MQGWMQGLAGGMLRELFDIWMAGWLAGWINGWMDG